jgi:hypothetical protein
MLDISEGKLYLSDIHFVIDKNLTKEKFLLSLSHLIFNKFESTNWGTYSIEPQLILGKKFGLSFTFKDSELKYFQLGYSEMEEIPYDEENEMKRKRVHDLLLNNLFGDPHEIGPFWNKYHFSWGTILSSLDPRVGQSKMYFSYDD